MRVGQTSQGRKTQKLNKTSMIVRAVKDTGDKGKGDQRNK